MNYKSPTIIKMDSINLGEFTPMELRCMESSETLKEDDLVVVLYLTKVTKDSTIPLEIPYIVKADKFHAFIDRFFELIELKRKKVSISPNGETTNIVKIESPPQLEQSSEKPT